MSAGGFVVEIASVPDREEVVVEIWYQGEHFAEVRTQEVFKRLLIFPRSPPWDFELAELLAALNKAGAQ